MASTQLILISAPDTAQYAILGLHPTCGPCPEFALGCAVRGKSQQPPLTLGWGLSDIQKYTELAIYMSDITRTSKARWLSDNSLACKGSYVGTEAISSIFIFFSLFTGGAWHLVVCEHARLGLSDEVHRGGSCPSERGGYVGGPIRFFSLLLCSRRLCRFSHYPFTGRM